MALPLRLEHRPGIYLLTKFFPIPLSCLLGSVICTTAQIFKSKSFFWMSSIWMPKLRHFGPDFPRIWAPTIEVTRWILCISEHRALSMSAWVLNHSAILNWRTFENMEPLYTWQLPSYRWLHCNRGWNNSCIYLCCMHTGSDSAKVTTHTDTYASARPQWLEWDLT